MVRTLVRLSVALSAAVLMFPAVGSAQSKYPDKPVRIVVPFPAGGPTDIFARLVAKKLSDDTKQQFFVENLPGSGGNVGTQVVTRARNDGTTVLFASASLAIAPSLYSTSLPFNPSKDLEPVALAGIVPMILVTHANGPASAKALVDAAKADPEKYSYASAGNGSATHLAGEAFKTLVGAKFLHVPYRGTAPALIDVIAGRHQFIFDYPGPIKPYLADKRLKVLAIAAEKRSNMMPDVPTFAEAGLPSFVSSTWNMFLVPAGTPKDVITTLNKALNVALNDPPLVKQLTELGIGIVSDSTPQSTKAFLASETKRWATVVEKSGARLD